MQDRRNAALRHIVENAQAISRYTTGMDLEAFRRDSLTLHAVERCLGRISEAACRVGALGPKWEALGDQPLDDEPIPPADIWRLVERDVPTLASHCAEALKRFE